MEPRTNLWSPSDEEGEARREDWKGTSANQECGVIKAQERKRFKEMVLNAAESSDK